MARASRRRIVAKNSYNLARSAYRGVDRAGSSLFRWMATNHNPGFGDALDALPTHLGFWYWLKSLVILLLIYIFGALLAGFLMFLLMAFGVPWFLTVLFTF